MTKYTSEPVDPGTRMQAITASIAAKLQQKRQQRRDTQAPAAQDPATVALLEQQIQDAQANGNHGLSIALKQALNRYLSADYPQNLK